MTTVSIIGTSGRKESLNLELYKKMILSTKTFLENLNLDYIILVSGGAAWSDHIAVTLFLNRQNYNLNIKELRLYLPCQFDMETKRFYDNGSKDWRVNPGKVLVPIQAVAW